MHKNINEHKNIFTHNIGGVRVIGRTVPRRGSRIGGIPAVDRPRGGRRTPSSHSVARVATTRLDCPQSVYLAKPHLEDDSLQVVLPEWQLPDMSIYALYPSRKHLSPAVRALLDFLVERFAVTIW
ncbi:LysR substrate-binding domain-containing protein [Undibacterium sp. SXout7W]|uniref:LysR substrate-binding domain-containing protein n=1 Tax=Undibacterium sp. SXout7W TaxID=3413049 RepID=UPI003BF1FEF3